jgi:Mycobacterial 4 TMS phage holin, superfamily IV
VTTPASASSDVAVDERYAPAMIRFLLSAVVFLGSAAIGLLVADLALDDMSVDGTSFVIVVVLFAALQAVLQPFVAKMARQYAPPLLGGIGLLSTFVALLITSLISDGLQISGADTWIFASLIIWIATMIATLLLPLIVFRKVRQERQSSPES